MYGRWSRVPVVFLIPLVASWFLWGCDDDSNASPAGDTGADTSPDTSPDVDPDVTPDAEPDVTPDAEPDTSSDVDPDANEPGPVEAREYAVIVAALATPSLDANVLGFDRWVMDGQSFMGTDARERIDFLEPGSTLEDQVTFMLEESQTWAAFDHDEILGDYLAKNEDVHDFAVESFGLEQDLTVFPREDFRALFAAQGPINGWETFYETYPETPGYLSFSRPAFNAAGTQALVHIELLCGPLCGSGAYVMLALEDGAWVWVAWLQDLLI
jgi:hypothetical protein